MHDTDHGVGFDYGTVYERKDVASCIRKISSEHSFYRSSPKHSYAQCDNDSRLSVCLFVCLSVGPSRAGTVLFCK